MTSEIFILSLLDLLLLLHQRTLARGMEKKRKEKRKRKQKKQAKNPMSQYFQTMQCAAPLIQVTLYEIN